MAVRTIKHGVLKIKDSAASAVTVNLAQGTLRYQIKNKPSSLVLDRGTADQWMLVDDVPLEFSFEVAVTNILGSTTSGFSNLTLADTNEEAANSQALSTRQSIAVSALALANQSQQSVLQLLR